MAQKSNQCENEFVNKNPSSYLMEGNSDGQGEGKFGEIKFSELL